jgi:hypothetical protein
MAEGKNFLAFAEVGCYTEGNEGHELRKPPSNWTKLGGFCASFTTLMVQPIAEKFNQDSHGQRYQHGHNELLEGHELHLLSQGDVSIITQ